jgi:hypothetical protein
MVSAMSVEAWRSCESEGVIVARVARGLQRRSSECVSDMVVVWCGQAGLAGCVLLARRQGSRSKS